MLIEKYSFGIGDRFAREGKVQLEAIQEINNMGIPVVPVWNKSYREHSIVKTTQISVMKEANEAVKFNRWNKNYYIDADHIGLSTVDEFIDYSNFFTIDVAHFIGQSVNDNEKMNFFKRYKSYIGKFVINGIEDEFIVTGDFLENVANKYLKAILEVKEIYNYIIQKKDINSFIAEVSMDECETAQTPLELFFILAELKFQKVDIQTIAPKFSGLFAKGIDYIGDLKKFSLEFEQDIMVIKYASEVLGLPSSLKLSVHSGSDKFSLYPVIKNAIKKFDAGIHIKTAGTTWLEEVIGLAQASSEGLEIAKKIYDDAYNRYDELTKPYETVLNIDKSKLPSREKVNLWDNDDFANALIHNQDCEKYNPNFRQLIHMGYKIAVELGDEFMNALEKHKEVISENVKFNILERHLKPLFL